MFRHSHFINGMAIVHSHICSHAHTSGHCGDAHSADGYMHLFDLNRTVFTDEAVPFFDCGTFWSLQLLVMVPAPESDSVAAARQLSLRGPPALV